MAKRHAQRSEPAQQDDRPFLTIDEACAIARCCRRTFDRWRREERFKTTRPIAAGSGRRLVDRATFMAFLSGAQVVGA